MRACTSPNSLANLLQESPASVLQKTSPLTLLASRKSGSAACVARFQIVPLGASGNGRVSQVCPRSRERCSAPRPPKALSPLPRKITWGSSALTSTPRQYGMDTWLLTFTGSQVAPLSVLEKISRGVMVNNVFGGPTVMARLWMSGSVTPLVTTAHVLPPSLLCRTPSTSRPAQMCWWSTGSTTRAVTLGMPTLGHSSAICTDSLSQCWPPSVERNSAAGLVPAKIMLGMAKAGADVLMAPGLPDLASVKAVCAAIAKPFNFMAGIPGMSFTVAELEAAGVRRISLAGSLYRAAMGGLVAAARELKDKGTFGYVDTALPSAELAGFMRG